MKNEEIIEKAIESLGEITYEPFGTAYYVTTNGEDRQGEDQCINCIEVKVKEERQYAIEQRVEIRAKYTNVRNNGNSHGDKVYTDRELNKWEKQELKKWPVRGYSYEGHDPDFGGGLTEPCSCESCGAYFQCEFNPCDQECDHLNDIVYHEDPFTDREKWELEAALRYYVYCEEKIKPRMLKIAQQILNRTDLTTTPPGIKE